MTNSCPEASERLKRRPHLGVDMERVLSLDEVDVEGRTVLVRVDINSSLDPSTKAFLDVSRITAILPTLNRLSKAKVVLLAHQSRPGKSDFTNTLGPPVNLVDCSGAAWIGSTTSVVNGPWPPSRPWNQDASSC